jgi:phosphatidylglycerol---prolipoprotein diacylglyceryl transferase
LSEVVILAPLVPFVRLPDWVLLPEGALARHLPPAALSVKPFGTLVALGVYTGAYLALRQARRVGLNQRVLGALLVWVVLGGFLGGHVLDTLFYYPGEVMRRPWSLVMLWEGQSSFGGFTGAAVGALGFAWRYRVRVFPYADVVASAFPTGWVFGRLGCALAHDHPGQPSQAWLAVAFPDGGRFDLGLLEMTLTVPLAVVFLVLRRQPRPAGFFLATMTLAYAPTRLALDFLRATEESWPYVPVVDPRYGPFTPAQWGCLLLLAVGVWLTLRVVRSIERGVLTGNVPVTQSESTRLWRS